jgi:nicotinamide mononucleotide adenylyltransferase
MSFDWKKETVQMLGRFQPWHDGHTELFKRAHAKTGQVVIMIRDCEGWNNSNPFSYEKVSGRIVVALINAGFLINRDYIIQQVPNIVNITYGRDVGYKIEQETFSDEIHSISATKIRKEMGID